MDASRTPHILGAPYAPDAPRTSRTPDAPRTPHASLISRASRTSRTHLNARPTLPQLESELARVKHRGRYGRIFRSTIYALLAVAALAVLVATLWLPVLQISGTSMTPTLDEDEIVVAAKGSGFAPGDVVALNYGSRILVKRVIAGPGDWVSITDDGTVYVNGQELSEPYLTEKALGKCDIAMPYQVPDGSYFVMGDHRSTSVDSRSSSVGCISVDDIVGKIVLRVWPLSDAGLV